MSDADLKKLMGRALARIWPDHGDPVGAGTLLADDQVLTCAHVVNAAIGASEASQSRPTDPIDVDFPFSHDRRRTSAHVLTWVPIGDDGGGDLCVLKLANRPPVDCEPAVLLEADGLAQHSFEVLGFPAGFPDGTLATGMLIGRNAADWVQMQDDHTTGPRVRPGFSGAPVWDRTLGGIVGIVVTSSDIEAEKTAFLIPSDIALRHLADASAQTAPVARLAAMPPLLDLGRLSETSRAQGRIEVRAADPAGYDWRQSPPIEPFSIESRPEGLVVTPTLVRPGPAEATVAISDATAITQVRLRAHSAEGTDPAHGRWPRPLKRKAVTATLQQWARDTALVPDQLFDGDLEIQHLPVVEARVTHVVERRRSDVVQAADRPDLNDAETGDGARTIMYEGPFDQCQVELPPWKPFSRRCIDKNSFTDVRCTAGDAQNRVVCSTCKGTTRLPCPRDERCGACRGTGWVVRSGQNLACAQCSGVGRRTCSTCLGAGSRGCEGCSDGKVVCPRCGGDGTYVRYRASQVVRVVEVEQTRSDWPEPGLNLLDEDFVPLLVEGASGVDVLPPALREDWAQWVENELSAWREGEVMRKLELRMAPAVIVRYERGRKKETALLVGDRVKAPRARRPGGWQVGRRIGARISELSAEEPVQEGLLNLRTRLRGLARDDSGHERWRPNLGALRRDRTETPEAGQPADGIETESESDDV